MSGLGAMGTALAEAILAAATRRADPDEQMRELLRVAGMGDGLVEAILGMSTGLRDDFTPEQAREATTTTPTTLATWAYDVLRPRL